MSARNRSDDAHTTAHSVTHPPRRAATHSRRRAVRTYSNVARDDEAQEQTACAVCAAFGRRATGDPIPHWQLDGYRFVRCPTCGHIYQNPRPAPSALDDRYSERYFRYELENAEQFLQLMSRGIADSGVMRRLSPAQPRTLLDIGCATGALLEHYRQQDWQVQGIELCRPAAHYARAHRNVAVIDGDYTAAALPDGHYTLVHSSHVIEHLPDPFHFLQYTARVLHPDGYAIIVTPNIRSMQAALMGSRWRSAIADHLHLFSARNLIDLARRADLRLVRKRSWGGLALGVAPPLQSKKLPIRQPRR